MNLHKGSPPKTLLIKIKYKCHLIQKKLQKNKKIQHECPVIQTKINMLPDKKIKHTVVLMKH